MRPCRGRVGRICCTTSIFAGSPLTIQRRENLTGTAIGDPTEDTGKGTEGTATVRNRKDRTTGAAQYAVAEEAVTLVGDRTGRTAEAEVHGWVMLMPPPPPPPTRTERGCRAAVRTVGTEVGRRRKKEKIDWGDGEKRNIRDDMPLSAQSEAMT